MNREEFISKIKTLNINYSEDILNKLDVYCDFLLEYNEHTNLTAIRNRDDVYLKHFYDSIILAKYIDFNNINNLIDIGTGAGFPGVIIKIFFPSINVVLLDSNNKKTIFLWELIQKLNLDNIEVVNERAEDYAKKHQNEFDICTSRAVAYMDIITSLSLPLIKKDGFVALMKGNIDEEKTVLENHQKDLLIQDFNIIKSEAIDNNDRNIVIIKKMNVDNKLLTYSQILKRHDKWCIK